MITLINDDLRSFDEDPLTTTAPPHNRTPHNTWSHEEITHSRDYIIPSPRSTGSSQSADDFMSPRVRQENVLPPKLTLSSTLPEWKQQILITKERKKQEIVQKKKVEQTKRVNYLFLIK